MNKPRQELEAMLRERLGKDFDAVVEMADLSVELKGNDGRMSERIQCLTQVARYTRPQLKAVEHSGSVEQHHSVSLAPDELRLMAEFVHGPKADG